MSDAPVGYAVFETAIGPCGIAWGPGGITGVQLPEDTADEVRETLVVAQPGAVEAQPPDAVRATVERIRALLAGDSRDDLADVELDMSGLTPFLRRTYAITRTITPGHTLTYGQIAERLGSPGLARAVGRAMGANPFPIIVPCHRVLGADGSIGGFSAHGGALTKRRMLLAEGVPESEGPALFGTEQLYPGGADSV
ncbi:MAG: cysteine methyltransferase [Actinobacteria bacterium 69-20]|nr:MAG: cysteine methyltransferase [Actinobacteria bacterium 69-20]